jgi:hypothetical protein
MTQQAANVIDFTAYRAQRTRRSPVVPTIPYNFAQGEFTFAIPVLMPMVIAWLPIWSMAVFSAGTPNE